MTEIPERVRALAVEREAARAGKDFKRADELRDQIAAEGFIVTDSPGGAHLEPKPRFALTDPSAIANSLDRAPALDVSFHLLYEGFRDDLERFLAGLAKHNDLSRSEVILVDNASGDGEWMEDRGVRAIHLPREIGWAEARNAGLKTSKGAVIVLVDLSIEPAGDVIGPLLQSFERQSVGVAGPFGLVSESMREWEPSEGPEVDAIEGYFLAVRREALRHGLICEKFRWYRNADIDLSFQVRALGYEARVVALPVYKHLHRGWEALDEAERAKRSKRNHYLFFDRWKTREDLLVRRMRDPRA